MAPLLVLLLAAPGTIRVEVRGGDAQAGAEVLAFRDGSAAGRAPVRSGVALLRGLPRGSYDLVARGKATVSAVERGVRTVHDAAPGADAVLTLAAAHLVTVKTAPGATLHCRGLPHLGGALRLPAGLHTLVVDHPRRVSSATRLLRVTGPMELEVLLEPGLVVLGRVVDREATPVAGARVEAFADGYSTNRWTLTDAHGGFGVSGFFGDVISLRVTAIGYAARLKRVEFFVGEERARTEVVLLPGSSVALSANTVVDAVLLPHWYEQALEEPRLLANHEPVRRRGLTVRFSALRPGRRYRILLSAPGRLPAATDSFLAPAAGRTLVLPALALKRAAGLRGIVKGAGAGLVVACKGPEGLSSCRTDRAGRYEFDGLDGGEHLLYIRHIDERGHRAVLKPGEVATVDLEYAVLDTSRAIEGTVTDSDGEPLAGVSVQAASLSGITNNEGAFRLEGLPRGLESFTVRFTPAAGCRALAKDPHLAHSEQRVRVGARLRVPLKRSGTLRLRIDTSGRPLARASLYLSGRSGSLMRRRIPRRAAGIEIHEIELGSYEVDVSAAGLLGTGGLVVAVRRGRAEPVTLRLAPGRRAAGRLVLRRTAPRDVGPPLVSDEPLSNGWVSLVAAAPAQRMATTRVEEDGSFLLDGLPLGRVVLCAGAPGLPTSALELDLERGDRLDLVIALQQGVEAAVLVTGEEERPLPGARVRILDMILPDFGIDVRDLAALGRFRRVVAGEADLAEIEPHFALRRTPAGRIAAPFLAPGSYRFRIAAPGYKPVEVGVRARTDWQRAQIMKNLENLPESQRDLTPRVRLARAVRKN